MKYPDDVRMVEAIYDSGGSRNPLIEALPHAVSIQEFREKIGYFPPVPVEYEDLTPTERIRRLVQIQSIFVPMDYMYYVYEALVRLIVSTYHAQTSRESIIRINALFAQGGTMNSYGTQPQSGALLGTPGIGKTTTIKRCLSLLPQVIEHKKYLGQSFFCKQVLWLFCECPSDSSIKTMAYNIVKSLDEAVGGNHLDYLYRIRTTASSAVVTYIKVLCLTYHVGLIVVDEVQNMVIKAKKSNQVRPLIRFLTELTNDSATAVYMSGTPLAETVFTAEEYLRRRTRGPRLLPLKPDGTYRAFLQSLWPYQYTEKKAVLTDQIANKLYDLSGGIPAYITKLFEEGQARAIMRRTQTLTSAVLQEAAEYLSITPPGEFGKGKCISDFVPVSLEEGTNKNTDDIRASNDYNGKRFYSNKRGRRSEKRDEMDLLCWFQTGKLKDMMEESGLLEEVILC